MKRISELPDERLLSMVYADYAQYRLEAIAYARAELINRGIQIDKLDTQRIPDSSPAHPLVALTIAINTFIQTVVRPYIFPLVFLFSLIAFYAANIYSYNHRYDQIYFDDGDVEFGFPFSLCTTGVSGIVILWEGLAANILIASIASLAIGFVSKKLFGIRSDECQ
ncbi:MAG: hypothetical protein L0229_25110 [Blastocatellia bacterium]|nr:hypothetical protein [Blastocatellia bacterium]